MSITSRTISVLAVTLVMISCATSGPNKGDFNLMSIEDEAKWGAELKLEVDKQLVDEGMFYQDPVIDPYIDKIGQRLLRHAGEVHFDYTFSLADSEVVNAFAIPGGHIYIYTGLIAQAESEAELAGVIAHEIGHIIGRHSSERMSAAMAASYAGDILVGTRSSQTSAVITDLAVQIVTTGGMLAYSRSQENEADLIGSEIMYKAGYNPRSMIKFFRRLESEGERGEVEVFLSTHPNPSDRRSKISEYVDSLDLSKNLIVNTQEFTSVQQRIFSQHPDWQSR